MYLDDIPRDLLINAVQPRQVWCVDDHTQKEEENWQPRTLRDNDNVCLFILAYIINNTEMYQ